MAKSIKKFLKSFTLIELIIVIAIITVLGASAFLLLSQWMSKSRDSRKITDLGTIDTAINISYTSNDKLPTPDNMTNIMFLGSKVWELGYFGDSVVSQIGGALTKTPSDPTTKAWYRYAQWDNKKYQLGTIVENEQFSDYYNRVYANEYFTRLQGSYNQSIIVTKIGADDVIIPAPSLIIDEFSEGTQELDEEHFWTNKGTYNLGEEQTNKLKVETLFSGNISELQDPNKYEEFKTKFTNTYSGTVFLKDFQADLDEDKIEKIVSAELKKVSSQNVSVQYLSCDGISHGQTKLFYKENNMDYGQSCDVHQKEFKCENGVWKDGDSSADLSVYKYSVCTVGPANNCEAITNNQTSLTSLNIAYTIPATEHGLGFDVEQIVNENNGNYKYTLQGNCNNGIFENIQLSSPILVSCNTDYAQLDGQCLETHWSGDATNGFTFLNLGQAVYPKSCKEIVESVTIDYKVGTNSAFDGTSFVNGLYYLKPNNSDPFKTFCDMIRDGGGRTLVATLDKSGQASTTWLYQETNIANLGNVLSIVDASVSSGMIQGMRPTEFRWHPADGSNNLNLSKYFYIKPNYIIDYSKLFSANNQSPQTNTEKHTYYWTNDSGANKRIGRTNLETSYLMYYRNGTGCFGKPCGVFDFDIYTTGSSDVAHWDRSGEDWSTYTGILKSGNTYKTFACGQSTLDSNYTVNFGTYSGKLCNNSAQFTSHYGQGARGLGIFVR